MYPSNRGESLPRHTHQWRLTQLTAAEAEKMLHPYYKAGSSVFICVLPECQLFATGAPSIDTKGLGRKR